MKNYLSEKSAEVIFIPELGNSQVGWEYPDGFLPGLKTEENSDSFLNQEPS